MDCLVIQKLYKWGVYLIVKEEQEKRSKCEARRREMREKNVAHRNRKRKREDAEEDEVDKLMKVNCC